MNKDKFKKHTMFSPGGKRVTADTYAEHLALEKDGYGHSPARHCGCGKNSSLKLKDACYNKVVSRYGKKNSAYRSGAIATCRKVGVSNWGEGKKKKK
jgi:hypothetical protein